MKKSGLLSNYKHLFNLLSLYLIILAWRGFLFASNDVVDVMSYAKYLQNTDLYPFDFYIQNIASTLPNERIIFSGLLSFLGNNLSWATLILHAFFSMLLLEGIHRISLIYLKHEYLGWLVPLVLFIPLYGIGIGDCELYYNMFIASLASKAIAIWALFYFLQKKQLLGYLLLIPATYIHPTVGAQLFLVFTVSTIFSFVMKADIKKLIGILIYLILAGIFIFLLQHHVYEGETISKDQLFEIFEFRLAHHFYPEYFGLKNWLISIFLIAIALTYFNRRKLTEVTLLLIGILFGMLVYTLSHFIFPLEIVLSSQWFKSFIWVELFAVIAIIGIIDKYLLRSRSITLISRYFSPFLWILAFVLFVLIHIDGNYISNKKHEFFTMDYLSDEALIALDAKSSTNQDAVYIIPMDFTEFKYFSERSLYIDYKTVVHRKNALGIWYERINQVYSLQLIDRLEGENLYQKGSDNYNQITLTKLAFLKQQGVSHLVIDKKNQYPLEIIAENGTYRIYEL